MFEKQVAIENNKNIKLLDQKDKEVAQLKEKALQLEQQSDNYEKRYAQLNPLLRKAGTEKDPSLHMPVIKGKDLPSTAALLSQTQNTNGGALDKNGLEEIKQLKQTILKQDEEIYLLKDMVKSTALQIKIKESELKRVKKGGSIPASPTHRKNRSDHLPSLTTNQSLPDDSFREPSKLDKLTDLSNKFRSQQIKGRTVDRGVQTGAGGQKHAQT